MHRSLRLYCMVVGTFFILSLLVLPSVAAYSQPVALQSHPNIGVGEPGNGGGHGGGHGGGGGFTCPTILGAESSVCSTNWSGYADTTSGGVTSVSGSWVVPMITCPSSGTTYVAIWVGIDGYSSGTVEQTGILGECNNGVASYSAWYEFYPNPSVTISSLNVAPGNAVSASVSSSSSPGEFTTTIVVDKHSYTASGMVSNAAQSSAEWIVERPSLCIGAHCRVTTLADFGTTSFSSASATISSSFTNVAITMVGGNNGPVLAVPSSLGSGGTTFSVTYQ